MSSMLINTNNQIRREMHTAQRKVESKSNRSRETLCPVPYSIRDRAS